MDNQEEPDTVCLGIAIDHRLRRLFRPLKAPSLYVKTVPGTHVEHILDLGRTYQHRDGAVSDQEIKVAAELAMPASTGGIAIALSQPAGNHPYSWGTSEVIRESPTLSALSDAVRTVSCHTVNELDMITVMDSLPFLEPGDSASPSERRARRNHFFTVVRKKQPDILLCMWRKKPQDLVSDGDPTQSLGIGRTFAAPPLRLSRTAHTRRVNVFHPSYSVNYNPQFSCFRQLLLLEVTHACGMQRGDWEEAEWMASLRRRCGLKASDLGKQ